MSLKYGNISIESIKYFLGIWPLIQADFLSIKQQVFANQEIFIKIDSKFCWSHNYEKPFKDHMVSVSEFIVSVLPDLKFVYQGISKQPDQIGAIPQALDEVDIVLSNLELEKNSHAARDFSPKAFEMYCSVISIYMTFKSLAVFGKSMNELLELACYGKDSALFDAIRIDKTVIGCPTAIERISRAEFFEDAEFFKKLKKALNGKLGIREQKNYQNMRLVFEMLHQVNAKKLSDEDLYELFVKELKIYPWDAKDGGNAKAIRKFADTYMNKRSTT